MKRQTLPIMALLFLSMPQYSMSMASKPTDMTVQHLQEKSIKQAQQSIQTAVKRAKIISKITMGSAVVLLAGTLGPSLYYSCKNFIMNKISPQSQTKEDDKIGLNDKTIQDMYSAQVKIKESLESLNNSRIWTVLGTSFVTVIGGLAIRGFLEKIMYLMLPVKTYANIDVFLKNRTSMTGWYEIVMSDVTVIAQDEFTPEQRAYALQSLTVSCNRLMSQLCTIYGYMRYRAQVLRNEKFKEQAASAQLIEEYLIKYTNDFVDSLNTTLASISTQQKDERLVSMFEMFFGTLQTEFKRFLYIEKNDEEKISFEGLKAPYAGPEMDPAIAAMMQQ